MTYTVVGLLGRGGMAVVELAVDGDGRHVARKRVSLSGSAQQIELARQRLRREAEVLASLHHPGILPLLAVEEDGHDLVLVMPRMAASLADRVSTSGPLPPAEVADIGRVLLDALATAHRQGVVHRDIKPANILFDQTGRPVLADFGVAATRQFTAGLTDIGTVVGTAAFIAPEQARGQPAGPASDVFSLGATLAYALTGAGPFGDGEPFVLMALAAQGRVQPLPRSVPISLRRPLAAMLDPRPARRPTAAASLGGPTGTQVNPLPLPPRRTRPRRGDHLLRSARRSRTKPTPAQAEAAPATTLIQPRPEATPTTSLVQPRPEPALAAAPPQAPPPTAAPSRSRRRRRSRLRSWARAVIAILVGSALVAVAALVAGRVVGRQGGPSAGLAPVAGPVPTVAPCTALPYQACGQAPAPFTDGQSCLAGHADYDGVATNGCEAASDFVAGTVVDGHQPQRANLVPADGVDTFSTYVHDNLLNFCTGEVRLTLTAPAGTTLRMEVADGSKVLASAVSRDGQPADARVGEPSCFSNNSTWLTVRVSAVEGRSATDFQLSRSGGW